MKLKDVRQNAGITITALANEARVSRSTIEKVEGDAPVRAVTAAVIARALSKLTGEKYTFRQLEIQTLD